MEHITKVEVAWITDVLKSESLSYRHKAEELKKDGNQTGAALYILRSEQYAALSQKFDRVLQNGGKRIAIDY